MYDEPTNRPKPWAQMFLGFFAFVFVVTISCSVGIPLGNWLSHALATDTQRAQQRIQQAEWHENVLLLQDVGAGALIFLVVGGSTLTLAFVWVKMRRNARLVYARDGVFPIERRQVGNGLWDRIRRANRRRRGLTYAPVRQIVLDHNLAPGHIRSYTLTEDGMVFQTSPDWDEERNRLAAVNMARQANNIQALGAGHFDRPTAGAMRALLEPRPPKPTGHQVDNNLPMLPKPAMLTPALGTALQTHRNPDELLLAYEPETGEPVCWNVNYDPGFCLFGGQRQGKTYIAKVVILSAATNGWHVVILDPEGGKDFSDLEHVVEWHRTDPRVILPQVRALLPEFDRRHELLNEFQAGDFRSLPQADQPTRMLLVMEEFKKMRASMSGADLAEFDRQIGDIATRGAKVGIYLLILAQDKGSAAGGWPQTLDVNLTGKATVRQGKKGYGNVGYFNAHQLQPRQVGYQDEVYQAYEVAGRSLRLEGKYFQYERLIPNYTELLPQAQAGLGTTLDLTPTPSAPVDESLRWDEVVDAWFAAHPEALEGEPNGINDLARVIATADSFPPDPTHPRDWPINWRAKQSVASDYYHRRRTAYHAGEWTPAGAGAPSNDGEEAQGQAVEVAPLDLTERTTGSLLDRLAEVELSGEEGRKIWAELNRRKVPGFPVQQ